MEFRHPILKKIMNNEITSLRITMIIDKYITWSLYIIIFYKYMNYKSRNNFGQILECKKMWMLLTANSEIVIICKQ